MDLSQELATAMQQRNVERVRDLLQQYNVNLRIPENDNLWLSVLYGNAEIIEMIIRAGADLNTEDPEDDVDGDSILHRLIRGIEHDEDYVRLAVLAIELGANVNARNNEGESMFQLAISCAPSHSRLLMENLHSHGAQVNNVDMGDVLFEAAMYIGTNTAEALPFLVALNNPDDEIRNQRTVTAIIAWIPTLYYTFQAFEEMLNTIINVDQHGLDGNTMLVTAIRYSRYDAVKALLDRGADIHRRTADGVLPIYAVSKLDVPFFTEVLISRGASVHDRNDDGKYPIHAACASMTVENLHFLLGHGASFNVADQNGKYPIHIACDNKCQEILHLLLSIGTPIDVTDLTGSRPFPLHIKWQNLYHLLHPTTILFIKQIALLHITTGAVSEENLAIIQADPEKLSFYQRCCTELENMNETVVFENYKILSLLTASTTKLSAFLRNTDFSVAIENLRIGLLRTQFPTYCEQLIMALEIAREKRDMIQNMITILEESFPVPIPYLPILKITHYVLSEDLLRVELDFYFALYKRIETEKLDFISVVMN